MDQYPTGFSFEKSALPFTDAEILALDKEISLFEARQLNPDVESHLFTKNELMASFAISKAENSSLSLDEAKALRELLINNPDYDFLATKLKNKSKLTQKDHDRLEFFNITKSFRELNSKLFSLADLNSDFIKTIHKNLTFGLDIFPDHLTGFTVYKSGHWRDNDDIGVGDYQPDPFLEIPERVSYLISWLKDNPGPTNIAVFHAALYALHPFNNGNKRVCRILEHLLLRACDLNAKNLYSPSYYYHQEKARYYKYLLATLTKHNLNYFAGFFQEAMTLSLLSVIKTAIEIKRDEFLDKQGLDRPVKMVLTPLIKHKKVQFKNLAKINKNKMARQTMIDYLQKALDLKIITKEDAGRATFYSLNFSVPEEQTYVHWLTILRQKLPFLPEEFKS